MKKILLEISDFLLVYSALFTTLVFVIKVPRTGSFSVTLGVAEFLFPFIGAIFLYAFKKYNRAKESAKKQQNATH